MPTSAPTTPGGAGSNPKTRAAMAAVAPRNRPSARQRRTVLTISKTCMVPPHGAEVGLLRGLVAPPPLFVNSPSTVQLGNRSEPVRRGLPRQHVLVRRPGAHHGPAVAVHQHLRSQRPAIVFAGHCRPV